jgi:3-methyladenine DNA glycosylase AlkD
MSAKEILDRLKSLGKAPYKSLLLKHGIPEPVFGVKIEELKKFEKQFKGDYQLALDLYDTGVYDAMYLAGLIADDGRMTKKDLNKWVKNASCPGIAEYTVPWVASQGKFGHDVAIEWIDSKVELVAASGWTTLSCLVALVEDAELDIPELKKLLARVTKTIQDQPSRVRHAMNGFVISVGCYVVELTELALATSARVRAALLKMGAAAGKVPDGAAYIEKVRARGALGKKRKTVKC